MVVFVNFSRIALERATIESDSLVGEKIDKAIFCISKYHGARGIPWESAPTMGQD